MPTRLQGETATVTATVPAGSPAVSSATLRTIAPDGTVSDPVTMALADADARTALAALGHAFADSDAVYYGTYVYTAPGRWRTVTTLVTADGAVSRETALVYVNGAPAA